MKLLRTLLLQLGILVALTTVAASATFWFHPRRPAWRLVVPVEKGAVTMEMVQEQWGGDVIWVDVRPPGRFAKQHMEGALSISLENWEESLFEHIDYLLSGEKPIVVYCDASRGENGMEAAKRLREVGMGDVFFLFGGWRR